MKLHNLLLATSGLTLGSGRKLIGCWVIGWVKIKSCCPGIIVYFNCYNVFRFRKRYIYIYTRSLVTMNFSLPVSRIK